MLSETETFWILDLPGTCVAQDGENADEVREKNQKYEEVGTKLFCVQEENLTNFIVRKSNISVENVP